jgi:hypothetical protein
MGILSSAGIHCRVCDCIGTYSGPTKVGNKACEICKHELRDHQVDTQVTYALDSSGRLPADFEIGAHFQ